MENSKIYVPSRSETAVQLLKNVYWWMTGALCVTALSALLVISNPAILAALTQGASLWLFLAIAEVILVIVLTATIHRMSAVTATLVFLLYSVLNGVTLSVILLLYTKESVVGTFLIAAGMFAAMALWGQFTKKDLSAWGRFGMMALIGLLIAMVVNIFLHSSMMYWGISLGGVLLFSILTAYDAQKIKRMLDTMDEVNDTTQKLALLGALTLYLDFINLFIHLLRILGRPNN